MFFCCFCNVTCNTIEDLNIHLLFGPHTSYILSKFHCKQGANCFTSFDTLRSFLNHLKSVHGNDALPHDVENVPQNIAVPVIEQPLDDFMDAVPDLGEDVDVNNADVELHNISLPDFVRTVCKQSEILGAALNAIPNVNR